MYDAAIIGGGPAGVSAAINLKLLNKNFIWFGESDLSKRGAKAEKINNYPGLYGVTGAQLMWAFKNHTESMDIKIIDEVITGIYGKGGAFTLLAKDKPYKAKCVILCLGAEAAKTAEGESDFVGKGISYCATCDGFLYRGKTIGVYLNDKKYEEEAAFLCSIAKKVYLFPMYQNCEISAENVEIIYKKPTKFTGTLDVGEGNFSAGSASADGAEGGDVSSVFGSVGGAGFGNNDKLARVHFAGGYRDVDGMFILKTAISPAALVKGLDISDGAIYTDKKMATSVDGVFAAGDCTGAPYQYAKAVGEGNVAAHSAVDYLGSLKA